TRCTTLRNRTVTLTTTPPETDLEASGTDLATKTFRLGELFSGPGGLGWAANSAKNDGARIVHQWATDYDADTCKTYATNICGEPDDDTMVLAGIWTWDHQVVHELVDIGGLAFGFPCNVCSTVGERRGFEGEFGPLYTFCVEALRQFQQDWFLA